MWCEYATAAARGSLDGPILKHRSTERRGDRVLGVRDSALPRAPERDAHGLGKSFCPEIRRDPRDRACDLPLVSESIAKETKLRQAWQIPMSSRSSSSTAASAAASV
jgi:hypothetical protein